MRINLEGVPAVYIPLIVNRILEFLLENDLRAYGYDEVFVFNRRTLISRLQELGNRKMLKRVNSNRHEYYFLFLNHASKTLKMISLPYTAEYIWALTAA